MKRKHARRQRSGLRGLASAVGLTLMGIAVSKELKKPKSERTWHGRLRDRIPYEFRPPTGERIRHAFWAPEDKRLFTDTAFGVGWSVNVGRMLQAGRGACEKEKAPESVGA
jgi:hypothetical protein